MVKQKKELSEDSKTCMKITDMFKSGKFTSYFINSIIKEVSVSVLMYLKMIN